MERYNDGPQLISKCFPVLFQGLLLKSKRPSNGKKNAFK